MLPVLRCAAAVLAVGCALCAQEFDSASIKPAQPGTRGYSIQPLPGRLSARNVNLKQLVAAAYHVHDFQIAGGPKWIATDTYDVEAKAADGEAAPDEKQLMAMLQTLLAKRFSLAIHRETKEQTVYVLQPVKSGATIQPTKDTKAAVFFRVYQRHQVTSANAPISNLVEVLSWVMSRPVVDRTGLTATYDYKLEWAPDEFQPASDESGAASGSTLPSLDSELQAKLGLRIVLERGPVEIITIDSAEKPAVN